MKRKGCPIKSAANSGNTAFTLIELLTVIAIIGVLAGILIPAMSGVREQAREASKSSMYRQYYIANTMYATDQKGMSCPTQNKDADGEDWRFFLRDYLTSDSMNKYRSRNSEVYVDPFFEEYDPSKPWVGGVGMNHQLRRPDTIQYPNALDTSEGAQGGLTLLSSVTYPAYRILIGDVTVGDARIYNDSRLDTSRHDGKGMFVRFDGSVTLYDQEEAVLGFNDPSALRGR